MQQREYNKPNMAAEKTGTEHSDTPVQSTHYVNEHSRELPRVIQNTYLLPYQQS